MRGYLCDGTCEAFNAGIPRGEFRIKRYDETGKPIPDAEAQFCSVCAEDLAERFGLELGDGERI